MFKSTTSLSAENFLPRTILDCLGVIDSPRAVIKREPGDFIVEEGQPHIQCTVLPRSDLGNQACSSGVGDLVEVTVVKNRMSTFQVRHEVAQLFKVPTSQVTAGGLKDRWAITAQRIVIAGVPLGAVRARCKPRVLTERGFFLKDPILTSFPMRRGQLVGNRFNLRVCLDGVKASRINACTRPMLDYLKAHQNMIPNAVGRQRLGSRQNLLKISKAFIEEGAQAGIKLYLLDPTERESRLAQEVRRDLALLWEEAQRKADERGETIEQQVQQWHSMRIRLEPHYRLLNMTIEFQIVEKMLSIGYREGFMGVVRALSNDLSLWIGAYHAFYFNQVLARILTGEIRWRGSSIPMFMDEPRALRFYRQHLPEAIPAKMDEEIRQHFLVPRARNGTDANSQELRGPWRKAFIPVQELTSSCEDGVFTVSFKLRSGAYATTFLGIMFDLEGDDESGG